MTGNGKFTYNVNHNENEIFVHDVPESEVVDVLKNMVDNYPNISCLHIHTRKLNDSIADFITQLSRISNLNSFSITDTADLDNNAIELLMNALRDKPINSLSFNYVPLTSESTKYICDLLEHANCRITVLQLVFCKIDDAQMSIIADALGKRCLVRDLAIVHNPLTMEGMEMLLKLVKECPTINEIDIYDIGQSGDDMKEIFLKLKRLLTVETEKSIYFFFADIKKK